MPLAMAFGGGGARGAFQAGAYAALAAAGIKPAFIVGTSIGAINALGTTRLSGAQLGQWWVTKVPRQMFLRRGGEVPFAAVLRELIDLPVRHPWPALAVTTAVATQQSHVVMLNQSPAQQLQWLLASAAIPHLYPAVTIDGARYVDGAVLNDLPLDIAYDLGATTVISIGAGGFGRKPARRADFNLDASPDASGILDFRVQSRATLLHAGWAAGEKLVQSPEFRAWRAGGA